MLRITWSNLRRIVVDSRTYRRLRSPAFAIQNLAQQLLQNPTIEYYNLCGLTILPFYQCKYNIKTISLQ